MKLVLLASALTLVCAPANADLIISPQFDTSITSDANAAAIEGAINSAIAVYETTIANPVTIKIYFQEGGGLGESDIGFVYLPTYKNFSGIKDTLYRIGQEAIANSIRHASPGTIRIRLHRTRASVCLSVEDDGEGFIPDADRTGFGLLGMRKRADSISATLTVKSAPGAGTLVEVKAALGSRSRLFAKHI